MMSGSPDRTTTSVTGGGAAARHRDPRRRSRPRAGSSSRNIDVPSGVIRSSPVRGRPRRRDAAVPNQLRPAGPDCAVIAAGQLAEMKC